MTGRVVPMLTSMSAGSVMSAPMTATNMTALAGTFDGRTLDQMLEPGIAPSRLKANVMRDALVRQAIVQKN